MFERVLLMGPPGTGKSYQLIKIAQFLEEYGIQIYTIDLEDKLEATLEGLGGIPKNMHLYISFAWDERKDGNIAGLKQNVNEIEGLINPGDWIAIDRMDLAWSKVQDWFTQEKYQQELADRLLEKSKQMKKSSMFIPRFDQGSWQVINEQYDNLMMRVLYKSRCNILLTAGIKGVDQNSPIDIGRLGILPRGQKELGHQPHSVFLLTQKKVGREITWHITTDKDLPGRDFFEHDELLDFSLQYLNLYYQPEKRK